LRDLAVGTSNVPGELVGHDEPFLPVPLVHGTLTMPADRRLVDCEAAMRRLWDYLDGELAPAPERDMRAHLAICARCHPRMAFDRAFLAAVAATRRPCRVSSALRARIAAALSAERSRAY
jgi:hypothetical protein